MQLLRHGMINFLTVPKINCRYYINHCPILFGVLSLWLKPVVALKKPPLMQSI